MNRNLLSLLVNEIADKYLKENFRRLNVFGALPGLAILTFTRLEVTLVKEETLYKFPHKLGFTPTDIMVTWITGPALIQFNYDKFDSTNVVLSTVPGTTPTKSDPAVIRFLVGSWDAGST